MAKNLKHQFLHAINSSFKEGMDKHSLKAQGVRNDGKIFSYSDRKNLIDTACNFSNYMKESHPNIKQVKDVTADHIQGFLNSKKDSCSKATLNQYCSKFNKLEKCVNNTYNTNANYKGFTAPTGKENTKIRNSSMSQGDFKKLENAFKGSKSSGATAIQLAARAGLRVSECTKLQGRDVDIKNNCIHVIGGKGGRNRDVPIRPQDKVYFSNLKASVTSTERICPVKTDSINKSVQRAMEKAGIKNNYTDTSIHCIRKMYAQDSYNSFRASGMSIQESLDNTSKLLGHGENRNDLMKEYVLNIH